MELTAVGLLQKLAALDNKMKAVLMPLSSLVLIAHTVVAFASRGHEEARPDADAGHAAGDPSEVAA